ncbi:unnamed protein product, partial [Pylaiella littoralis]
VEQGVAWTRILCAMWSPDRRRGPDHRQSSRETCSWEWIHPQRIATTARMEVILQRQSK